MIFGLIFTVLVLLNYLCELIQIMIMDELKKLEDELKLKMSSPRTIGAYLYWNRQFLDFVKKQPEEVAEDDVKSFLASKIGDISPKSVALILSALRYFYKEVLKRDVVNIKTPKIPKTLPVVLTREETKRLIEAVENEKHRLIVELLYSSGLRVSEVMNLKVGDLELGERSGWVRSGKGEKDRLFFIADSLVEKLKDYIRKNGKTHGDYLFAGRNGKMSSRNVQKIVKLAAKNAGIGKNVHPHTLRHSFATHMLESGINIRQIQRLLGHENIGTTEIYTSISPEDLRKIKNPLDALFG